VTIENLSTQATKRRLQSEFDNGMADGYDAANQPLPSFYLTKKLFELTARERGFWYGRETRLQEEGTK
jgi:pyridoxine/pyridoxamine 5'-phosphate oxidase